MIANLFRPAHLFLALMSLGGCVVAPVPWFPEDPLEEDIDTLKKNEVITREDVLRHFGTPWAAWNDDSFIYITDKPSSYVVAWVGDYGGSWQMTHKDFVLQINFDDQGVITGYQNFADTGDRDYCFTNGICFSRITDNVPLGPLSPSRHAGDYAPEDTYCTIYLYRDSMEGRKTYDSYVEVFLRKTPEDVTSRKKSIGSSVANGVHRWRIEAGSSYEIRLDFNEVRFYPFNVSHKQSSRSSAKLRFACGPGEEIYIRLSVPNSTKKDIEFEIVGVDKGRTATADLPLLLGKYAPDILKQ